MHWYMHFVRSKVQYKEQSVPAKQVYYEVFCKRHQFLPDKNQHDNQKYRQGIVPA